VGQCPTW